MKVGRVECYKNCKNYKESSILRWVHIIILYNTEVQNYKNRYEFS